MSRNPETVIVATGSRLRRELGHPEGPRLVDADEVIEDAPTAGTNATAVVIDDDCGFVGPTAGAALAKSGWTVTIATPLPMLAGEVDATLIRFVHERLATVNPRIITDVRLLAEPGPDVVLEHVLTAVVTTLPTRGSWSSPVAGRR
jgi:pyruvate/2-oxoglutarate dehydrogenase complex dihydrolipoamide dehydrogenase (E3) component